ncbi:hypothetical protein [Nitrososphaera sp.]|uniref:hypothetical protein n=1 Tax=Nitrososphaera sp. TaxID=1971748 RepID=UPI00307FABB3
MVAAAAAGGAGRAGPHNPGTREGKGNACKYAQMCKFYRSQSYTCSDQEEASTYCGTYDLFDNFKPQAIAER